MSNDSTESSARFTEQVTALVDLRTRDSIRGIFEADGGLRSGVKMADIIRLAFELALPLIEELAPAERKEAYMKIRFGRFSADQLSRRIKLAEPAA